jgi:hypothetical protein
LGNTIELRGFLLICFLTRSDRLFVEGFDCEVADSSIAISVVLIVSMLLAEDLTAQWFLTVTLIFGARFRFGLGSILYETNQPMS